VNVAKLVLHADSAGTACRRAAVCCTAAAARLGGWAGCGGTPETAGARRSRAQCCKVLTGCCYNTLTSGRAAVWAKAARWGSQLCAEAM
jgi:hypothetical protein